MNPFTYSEPVTVDETLAALTRYGEEAKLIAGGTGLINLMKQRLVNPGYLIGLRRLSELKKISVDRGLRIGALCTLRTLETSPLVREHAPLLAEASRHIATIRIRTMATIGGAVAHADPNQDLPPALIALDARVKLRSPKGEREVPIDQFFTGYYETVVQPDEMVTELAISQARAATGYSFLKFLPQTADDYATVGVAATLAIDRGRVADVRVALGAAGSTPIRASIVEDSLRGQEPNPRKLAEAAAMVAGIVDPVADFRGSAEYKRDMAVVFVRRALAEAANRAQGVGRGA
ncbi:MAG TPA: xanthine dehydrogenase family protein subunit M [Candidatus Binataceae bacterium]|nr:xanthine dehydrogenase family protein subunit M [Candidatus Binataceae bacterium]